MSIKEASKLLRAAPSTVYRHIMHGIGGVKLESIKLGGKRVVSRESLNRFIARLNRSAAEVEAPVATMPADIDRGRLEAELDSALKVA